jgi:hypothetical protein
MKITPRLLASLLGVSLFTVACSKDEDDKPMQSLMPGASTEITQPPAGDVVTSTGTVNTSTGTVTTSTSTTGGDTPNPVRPVKIQARLVHNMDTMGTLTIGSTKYREPWKSPDCEQSPSGAFCQSNFDTRMNVTYETAASSVVVKTRIDGFDELVDSCPDVIVPIINGEAQCKPQMIFYLDSAGVGGTRKCEATCVTGEFSKLPYTMDVTGYGADQHEASGNLTKMQPIAEARCEAQGGHLRGASPYEAGSLTPFGWKTVFTQWTICD